MVGIVIVAHSATLAEGVRELADQVAQGKVRLATAGGVDDPKHPFGTDAARVSQAVQSVYSDDGVVVLMDLGSALLSAETALEFLTEEQRANVHLCEAPLVEGAIAAAVQAAIGSDVKQVLAEARGALAVKIAQLRPQISEAPVTIAPTAALAADELHLTVRNRLGLHARPAAKFVSTAARFQSDITLRNVTRLTGPVSAKSINQVATLGVRQGHEIAIAAQGPDAGEALSALRALVEANFGEEVEPGDIGAARKEVETSPAFFSGLKGIPASPGIVIGPVATYHPALPPVQEHVVDNPQAEWGRLRTAIQTAQKDIQSLRARAASQVSEYEASIFDAHMLFLQDPALVDVVRQRIFDRRINAEAAWQAVVDEMMGAYRVMEDEYMRARAADVGDVGQRVLRLLMGTAPADFRPPVPSILAAADLTPSDTVQLAPEWVLGICTEVGGATSHSAILARSLGIPAVVGVGPQLARLSDGTLVALNGETGQVWINPTPDERAGLEAMRERWLETRRTADAASHEAAVTRDGHKVEIAANIRGLVDAQAALDHGAEGVGLLRTEFLYLDRLTAPSEDEQAAAYEAIAQVMGTRPLIIRTLDVGGDKPLPYLDIGQEANPFLGYRAIRLCLDRPDLLKTQLRAILRASPEHQIKIMFPMIATLAEARAAKAVLSQAQAELRQAGIPFDEKMEIGIMIEVPSAVIVADQLAAEVDFFSIGSNDLSQYTLAADRTNARVASLADAFQPAVLRLVRQTIQAGHAAGIWVGVCGELAGDPLSTPILLGLGLDEFSMNPLSIPQVKHIIRCLTLAQSKELAEQALASDSADQVRDTARARLTVLGCLDAGL